MHAGPRERAAGGGAGHPGAPDFLGTLGDGSGPAPLGTGLSDGADLDEEGAVRSGAVELDGALQLTRESVHEYGPDAPSAALDDIEFVTVIMHDFEAL